MIKITSIRPKSARRYSRYGAQGSTIFAESNASNVVDKFFQDHQIYALNFKCKTWNKAKNLASKLNINQMHTLFGDRTKIVYSRTAGCSCGCSPGYRMSAIQDQTDKFRNKDIWVKIKLDPATINVLKHKLNSLVPVLENEIAAEANKKG